MSISNLPSVKHSGKTACNFLIYIDPPYNTGSDFVYEDDFADPMRRYVEVTQQTTKSNPDLPNHLCDKVFFSENFITQFFQVVHFVIVDPMRRYVEVTQQTTKSNPETMGRYHTNWLNMMYPLSI